MTQITAQRIFSPSLSCIYRVEKKNKSGFNDLMIYLFTVNLLFYFRLYHETQILVQLCFLRENPHFVYIKMITDHTPAQTSGVLLE